ncbi:16S rRNA (adenine(1518)-N(6)/adenine(1519)-N(6))-dimethyltransferase RsmA [Blattabacterium cuenoti]|uniref:16S rRNA (adenine(1518)-N(6)/adenine(1519)-N(6))- dimethyltransferase RsmA n=1 Tax=Blattabacterium cuenoti TaxID=1653831 RepID=UPI00163BAF6E|nr:16S rRNA (adenine(1518)-N(6)/adenine(1519)-N(6))-dimethyltransferase RsmA [Blattabacterium cuenoti]
MYKSHFKKIKFDQYFLKNNNIARKIVDNLSLNNYNIVVEIGPGLGILTKNLLKLKKKKLIKNFFLIEIDKELITFIKKIFFISDKNIINRDFLKWNPEEISLYNFAIIGNFPYSISSKILFHILKYHHYIPECIGMFQKEFVERILSKSGKKHGILSILVQSFYEIKYLFTVKKNNFLPFSRVESSVIFLKRKKNIISFEEKKLFFKCVKIAFNQRRKKLKNSLQSINILNLYEIPFLNKRAEELSIKEFIQLIKEIKISNVK